MLSRKIHKIIGLMLVLPLIGWIITGLIFFIKPGYQAAYDQLSIKTYPLEQSFTIPHSKEWQETRIIKTIIGYHLLVKTSNGFEHLDLFSYQPKDTISNQEFRILLDDAFLNNTERYGIVISTDGLQAKTSTGIDVTMNWNRLSLRQSGKDTKFINLLYKIHYLQWTPFKNFNQFLGFFGLFLVMLLTLFGIKLYVSNRKQSTYKD